MMGFAFHAGVCPKHQFANPVSCVERFFICAGKPASEGFRVSVDFILWYLLSRYLLLVYYTVYYLPPPLDLR